MPLFLLQPSTTTTTTMLLLLLLLCYYYCYCNTTAAIATDNVGTVAVETVDVHVSAGQRRRVRVLRLR